MNNLAEIVSVIIIGLIGGIAVGLQGPMSGAISQRLGPLGSSLHHSSWRSAYLWPCC